jgi:hypothetical protein
MTFSALPAASGGNGRRGSPTEAAYGLARGSNRVAGVERDAPDAAKPGTRHAPLPLAPSFVFSPPDAEGFGM